MYLYNARIYTLDNAHPSAALVIRMGASPLLAQKTTSRRLKRQPSAWLDRRCSRDGRCTYPLEHYAGLQNRSDCTRQAPDHVAVVQTPPENGSSVTVGLNLWPEGFGSAADLARCPNRSIPTANRYRHSTNTPRCAGHIARYFRPLEAAGERLAAG
jgi:hypothetical protein